MDISPALRISDTTMWTDYRPHDPTIGAHNPIYCTAEYCMGNTLIRNHSYFMRISIPTNSLCRTLVKFLDKISGTS